MTTWTSDDLRDWIAKHAAITTEGTASIAPLGIDGPRLMLAQLDSLASLMAECEARANGLVLAADRWTDNAELIVHMSKLGFIDPDWRILDPTYGLGAWWPKLKPTNLFGHDLNADKSPLEACDFRKLGAIYRNGYFRLIAYDPPYVSVGGRATSTIPDTYDRFGLMTAPETPEDLQVLMDQGATALVPLLEDGGYFLYKCMNYITNGAFWDGVYRSTQHALSLGLVQVDQFEMIGDPGAQPELSTCLHCRKPISKRTDGRWFDRSRSTEQSPSCAPDGGLFGAVEQAHEPTPGDNGKQHAARNLSTMLVFQKPAKGRRRTNLDDAPAALFEG